MKTESSTGPEINSSKLSRYTTERPQLLPLQWHSFVGQGSHWRPCPPAVPSGYKRKSVIYIQNDTLESQLSEIGRSKDWKIDLYLHVTSRVHTHTHLLRNILSNYWCGMHLTCKNNSVKLTGIFGRFGVRNLSEVFLRLSSDAAQIADCENRTVIWVLTCWKNLVPVLGLAGCHFGNGKLQVRFHRNIAASSLAADCNVPQRPPAWNCCLTNRVNPVKPNRMINQMAAESRSFTSFQMVHTHASLPRGFFLQEALIGALKLDVARSLTQNTGKAQVWIGCQLRESHARFTRLDPILPPFGTLGSSTCEWFSPNDWQGGPNLLPRRSGQDDVGDLPLFPPIVPIWPDLPPGQCWECSKEE